MFTSLNTPADMYAKTASFESELQQLASYAKLLSHPARIAIIRLLAEKNSCVSGDISNELPLSRTTVSQHLQELKKSGLIDGTVSGLNVCYCLNQNIFERLRNSFSNFLADITEKCCGGCC